MDIAIIDYGVGNLRSAEKAFQHLGFDAALTRDPKELAEARKIVLPGVGNFRECMERLREHGFVAPLMKEVEKGKPLLGICVGLQMLFEGSEESPGVAGLGLLKGRVRKFGGEAFRPRPALTPRPALISGPALTPRTIQPSVGPLPEGEGKGSATLKIPQIGWNGLTFPGGERHALFADVTAGSHVYFVHSFYCLPDEIRDVLAWSDYGGDFCASAGRGNVMGVQFHPEKSQRVGLGILGNFVRAGLTPAM